MTKLNFAILFKNANFIKTVYVIKFNVPCGEIKTNKIAMCFNYNNSK